MASVVNIQVHVDNGQALPSIDQLNNALKTVGVQGEASFNKVNEAAASTGGHFQTNLDSVRLLSQEFGFRLPRAIESMLSRMPAVTSALNSMLGVMAGIAAAQVFVYVAERLHHVYEEYLSLDTAQQKYLDNVEKARQGDIGNTRSIETARERLAIETQVSAQLKDQAADLVKRDGARGESAFFHNLIGGGIVDRYQAAQLEERATEADVAKRVLSRKVGVEGVNNSAVLKIEGSHARDAELLGRQKINAELQKKLELDEQEQKYTYAQEQAGLNPVSKDAGAAEQAAKDAQARAEAAAQNTILDRKERDERIAAQNEAVNAGLEGEAKYVAQRDESIAAIARKFEDGEISQRTAMSETASLSLKYDNEHSERVEKQIQEAQQMVRVAQESGLTGGARISAEHNNAIDKINTDRTLDPQAASLQRQAAAITADQKMTELEDQFADHVRSLDAGRLESSLSAYDRIEAGAQKEIADLQKLYDQDFKNAQLTDAQKEQSAKNLQSGISAINSAAAQQERELAQRNQQEDLRYDQEESEAERRVRSDGILGWTADYKQGIAEIQAEEQQRLAKLQEDVSKEGLTYQEAAKRQVDIEQTAAAQIEAQNQQMQEKIAGDLQSAFNDPVEFIKSRMEKMFFDIVAGWIMRMNIFKGIFGQTMGGLQPGAPGPASGGGSGVAGILTNVLHGAGAGSPSISSSGSPLASAGGFSISGTRGIVGGNPTFSGGTGDYGTIGSAGGSGGFAGNSGTTSMAAHVASATPGARSSAGSTIGGIASLAQTLGKSGQTIDGAMSSAQANVGGGGFAGSSGTASMAVNAASGSSSGQTIDSPTSGTQSTADDSGWDPLMKNAQTVSPASTSSRVTNTTADLTKLAGVGMAAYTGEQTTVKAFETGSPLQGALGDAAAGAMIGSLGGPLGTAIGAAVGAGIGASAGLVGMVSGEAGNLSARSYYEKSVYPQLAADMNNSSGDFQAAIADVGNTSGNALAYMTNKFGASAANWVNDSYMKKEASAVVQRITDTAAGGRAYTTRSAAQFHDGGTIAGFGSLATSSTEGFIHAMLGETVMDTRSSATHGPALSAMRSGASESDIAAMYLAQSKPGGSLPSASGGDTHHWSVNALDGPSFSKFLKNGGAQQVVKHINSFKSQYAGDGISG